MNYKNLAIGEVVKKVTESCRGYGVGPESVEIGVAVTEYLLDNGEGIQSAHDAGVECARAQQKRRNAISKTAGDCWPTVGGRAL